MVAALLPLALGAATLAGGLLGKNKGAHGEQHSSGFGALPQEVQQAYLKQYLPSIQKQFSRPNGLPLGEAMGGQFGSQGLQELQNYSNQTGGIFPGTTGVSPIGGVEPLNQFQQGALGSFGSGLSGLQNELPAYQDLYNQNVLEPELANIGQQHAQLTNQLKSSQLRNGGVNAFSNSAFGTQLSGLEDIASRARLNARANAFQGGQNLRRMTLQDMLNAGNQVQGQNQNLLNYLQPQLQQTTPQGFAQGLSAFPQSTNTQGAYAGTPNVWSKIGGLGQLGLGLGAGGLSGFNPAGAVNAGAGVPQPQYGGNFLNNPY